jgi:hypothetical protein
VRRIPLSYRSHVTGFQGLPSGAIDYESALERDFVLLTLFDDPSARIRSQPVTLNFEHEGRHRRYTPDYLIEGGARRSLRATRSPRDQGLFNGSIERPL